MTAGSDTLSIETREFHCKVFNSSFLIFQSSGDSILFKILSITNAPLMLLQRLKTLIIFPTVKTIELPFIHRDSLGHSFTADSKRTDNTCKYKTRQYTAQVKFCDKFRNNKSCRCTGNNSGNIAYYVTA